MDDSCQLAQICLRDANNLICYGGVGWTWLDLDGVPGITGSAEGLATQVVHRR